MCAGEQIPGLRWKSRRPLLPVRRTPLLLGLVLLVASLLGRATIAQARGRRPARGRLAPGQLVAVQPIQGAQGAPMRALVSRIVRSHAADSLRDDPSASR